MSSGFITESEIAEARKKRQEDWEKVRNSDQPLEAPEETIDHRSLYDRLQEQKQKKDLEYEEAHKLKNMIKGLDDDEIEFLDLVDRTKLAAERMKNIDEERELNEYRTRVASLQEKSLDQRLNAEKASIASKVKPVSTATRNSQLKLLKGAVVTKNEPKKRKHSDSEENDSDKSNNDTKSTENTNKSENPKSETNKTPHKRSYDEMNSNKSNKKNEGAMTCIGILPGLGFYDDSTESDVSTDSEEEAIKKHVQLDLCGRLIEKKNDKDK